MQEYITLKENTMDRIILIQRLVDGKTGPTRKILLTTLIRCLMDIEFFFINGVCHKDCVNRMVEFCDIFLMVKNIWKIRDLHKDYYL